MMWTGAAQTAEAAAGTLGLGARVAYPLAFALGDRAPAVGTFIQFGPAEGFTREGGVLASALHLGTAGLLAGRAWGVVLDSEEDDGGEEVIESTDWGEVIAAGLLQEVRRLTLQVQTRRTHAEPAKGDQFSWDGRLYTVFGARRKWELRKIRETMITALHLPDLPQAVVTRLAAMPSAYGW